MESTSENILQDKGSNCYELSSLGIIRVAGIFLSFIIPCLMFTEVTLVGRLFAPEIILLCLTPVLLFFRAKWLLKPLARKIIVLALLWLSSQIITDIIRVTPFEDWSRGWSKIIFFLVNFSIIFLLLSNRQIKVTLFCAGLAVGQILTFYIHPNEFAAEYPWKFGVGYPITVLAVLLSQTNAIRSKKYGAELVIGVAALVNLLYGSRSLALICIATMVYVYFNSRSSSLQGGYTASRFTLMKIIILIVGVVIISGEIYEYAALNGWLSEKDTRKYIQQSSGKYGLLLSGRTEFLASSAAILDSPIIGHGSWAKNPKYTYLVAYLLSELEYENPQTYIRADDLIPSHSYLFGAWVESGIIGAVFWGWVWCMVLYTLVTLYNARDKLLPLVAFTCFNMLWNIMFSPFGAENRIYVAYNLVLIIFVLTRATPIAQLANQEKRN